MYTKVFTESDSLFYIDLYYIKSSQNKSERMHTNVINKMFKHTS